MIPDVLITYLNDNRVSLDNKRKFIEICNLQLSDICNLINMYNGNTKIYSILRDELSYKYDVNKFDLQMKKYRRKQKQAEIGRRQKVLVKGMKGEKNGKHKRR